MQKYILIFLILILVIINNINSEAAERLKVAILSLKINAPEDMGYLKGAVNDMLASRIGVEPVIEIVKEDYVKTASSKYHSEITEDIAKNIGIETGAKYIIYGSVTVVANTISIDAKALSMEKAISPIFFISQGKGLENLVSIMGEMAEDIKIKILNAEGLISTIPGQSAYSGKFTEKEISENIKGDDFIIVTTQEKFKGKNIWKSPMFAASVKGIEIADVDGDGKNEIIIIDRHNLFVYRLDGQKFDLIKEFKGDVSIENHGVAAADMNNNNIPEIYVTRIVNDRLNSYVLEYKDKEFKTIASNLKWFIKVFRLPKTAPMLIGQRYSDTEGFFKTAQGLDWKDETLQESSSAIDIPAGLNLYDFELTDLDKDGNIDVTALDARGYLKAYNKEKNGLWKEMWKSGEFYGGSLNHVKLGTSDIAEIKARILYVDTDGDGLREIIISKNDPGALGRYLKTVRSYDNSELINLTWEGYGLEDNWKTKKMDGYLADYAVHDINNDGQNDLVMLVVTESGEGNSYIIAYPVEDFRGI